MKIFTRLLQYSRTKVPKLQLSDGYEMPILGLGTFKMKGETQTAIKFAIDIGYRHFDCAAYYRNEPEVGAAIEEKISKNIIKRDDIFVCGKLWSNSHKPDLVEKACRKSLGDLKLDYLNLYLVHWPFALKEGIANFNKLQIERLLSCASICPVNLQIECHPLFNQSKLIEFAKSKGLTVTAYSPLGAPGRSKEHNVLGDPRMIEIAKKYNKTPAQLALRWQIEREVVVIPKSANQTRLKENFDIFNFSINNKDDIECINKIDMGCKGRTIWFDNAYGHPDHPFENDEY